jgi:catecholate siderophore receptor
MDDQAVVTLRDAAQRARHQHRRGEGGAQGDNDDPRLHARNDLYLDGVRISAATCDPVLSSRGSGPEGAGLDPLFGRGSTGGVVEQDSKCPGTAIRRRHAGFPRT